MAAGTKNKIMMRAGKLLFATGLSLLVSTAVFAEDNLDEPDQTVPFDGGVTLLVAAGVAYGVKQWKQNRTEANETDVNEK